MRVAGQSDVERSVSFGRGLVEGWGPPLGHRQQFVIQSMTPGQRGAEPVSSTAFQVHRNITYCATRHAPCSRRPAMAYPGPLSLACNMLIA